ncbi:MAG: N-acetyltransferase [Kordia sp.]|nr:MAG: N-acetyltransferase [Kordia sp.]
MTKIAHDKIDKKFRFTINGEEAWVDYVLKGCKMYLVHSEVPYDLRGRGIGKEMVLQTFEKLTEEGYEAVAVCSYIKAIAVRSEQWKTSIG